MRDRGRRSERDRDDMRDGGVRGGCPGGISVSLEEECMSWMLEMDSEWHYC